MKTCHMDSAAASYSPPKNGRISGSTDKLRSNFILTGPTASPPFVNVTPLLLQPAALPRSYRQRLWPPSA
ncbi:hypothetical protein AAC387_Pa06g2465 [Persea americana]